MLSQPSPSTNPIHADRCVNSSACVDAAFASPLPIIHSDDDSLQTMPSQISTSTHSIDSMFAPDNGQWLSSSFSESAISVPLLPRLAVDIESSDDHLSASIDSHFEMRTSESAEYFLRDFTDEDVLDGVTRAIEAFLCQSDRIVSHASNSSIFDAAHLPTITVRHFLEFVLKERMCSRECLAMSLIYCERLLQRHPTFRITRFNIHRLLLALIIISTKMIDDHYCRNSYFAQATRISVQDVNNMEMQLCDMLAFKLHVDVSEFSTYWQTFSRFGSSDSVMQQCSSPRLNSPLNALNHLNSLPASRTNSGSFALFATGAPQLHCLQAKHPLRQSHRARSPFVFSRPQSQIHPAAHQHPLQHPDYALYLSRLSHNFDSSDSSWPHQQLSTHVLPPIPPMPQVDIQHRPGAFFNYQPHPFARQLTFPIQQHHLHEATADVPAVYSSFNASADCQAYFALTRPSSQIWEMAPLVPPPTWRAPTAAPDLFFAPAAAQVPMHPASMDAPLSFFSSVPDQAFRR